MRFLLYVAKHQILAPFLTFCRNTQEKNIALQQTSTPRLRNQHSVLLRPDFNTQLRGERRASSVEIVAKYASICANNKTALPALKRHWL
jgi:hypothetical protein